MLQLLRKFREKYPALAEIIRSALVSLTSKIVYILVMALVYYLFDPALYPDFLTLLLSNGEKETVIATVTATAVGFAAATVTEFILSYAFVFHNIKKEKKSYGFWLFLAISLGGLGIHEVCQLLGNALWNIPWVIINFVVGFFVLGYNYIVKKLVVFRKIKQKKPNGEKE